MFHLTTKTVSTSKSIKLVHTQSRFFSKLTKRGINKTTKRMNRMKRKARGKKTSAQEHGKGKMWTYHELNLHYNRKTYLPLMNTLRKEGYWLPYWLDLHPERKLENEPYPISNIRDNNTYKYRLRDWFNEEELDNNPNIFTLQEKSHPHFKKPGGPPPPSTPPKIYRLEPPKPNEKDL